MLRILTIAFLTVLLAACSSDPNHTGRTFVPDMQYTPSVEPYAPYRVRNAQNNGWDTINNHRKAVKGTIARGELVYNYPVDDRSAWAVVENPVELNDKVLTEGKELYSNYCMICHGKKGDGNGTLPASEKYPAAPPSYIEGPALELAAGEIYHTITFGKNVMGAHAGQLLVKDRWKIVHYIQSLQAKAKKQD